MKHYNITDKNLHHLIKDPAFWKSLKRGDEVCGREVVREANDTACGWPQLNDLMDDEGRNWLVCRENCSNCTEQNEIIKCVNIDYCGHDSTIMAKERFQEWLEGWVCTNCLSDAHDSTIEDYHWEG